MTIKMFFQSDVLLKPGEEFARYQKELASLCSQRLELLDRFTTVGRIVYSLILESDIDYAW